MTIRKPRRKNNRQLWILLALLVAVIAVIALLPSGDGAAAPDRNPDSEIEAATLVKAGDQAPDFTVEMFDGSRVTLADLRGKVVLLNFWATWCPPCREELTHVQTELIDRFAGRPFVFLPVSRGESRETVAAFREKTGYEFPMGLDSTQSVYKRYAANYIPRNFLIDADGRVVSTTVGFEKSEFEELIRSVEAALGEDTPCEK